MSTVKDIIVKRVANSKEKKIYLKRVEQELARETNFRHGIEKKYANTCWCQFV